MKYENHQPPEGINVSNDHPLKEFFSLLLGLCLLLAITLVTLGALSQWLAPHIPFEQEIRIANAIFDDTTDEQPGKHYDKEQYLQALAQRLSVHMALPEDIVLRVRYSNDATVNAYASLGGNIVLYRGLLEKLPNENAVAMVLAHEIGHIKRRHPIVAAGRGLTVGLAIMGLTGLSDSASLDRLVNTIGFTSMSGFSRHQERIADDEALLAVYRLYGHVNGASSLFRILADSTGTEPLPFLSTHPASDKRIAAIEAFAEEHPGAGKATPIPVAINF